MKRIHHLGLAGLLLLLPACHDVTAPTASPRAAPRPGPSLTTAPAEACIISLWYNSACSVTAQVDPFLHQSSINSPIYQGPITVTFSAPVTSVRISGSGAVWCLGDIGTLEAYDSTGAMVESRKLEMIDPSDCGADDVTFGGAATLTTTTPVKKLVIVPPSPFQFQFTLYGQVYNANTTASYSISFSPWRQTDSTRIELAAAGGALTRPSQWPGGECRRAPVQRQSRAYTLRMVRRTSTGEEPVANTAVRLTHGFVDAGRSGHLSHTGTPPLGSFARDAEVRETTVTTDPSGRATFLYWTHEYSSRFFVRAEADGVEAKADTFEVGVALPLFPASADWVRFGGGRDKHADVWYAMPRQAGYVLRLAREYRETWGRPLNVNDMGLPLGGRFDVNGWQDPSHCSHRWGNAADVRSRNWLSTREIQWIKNWWRLNTGIVPLYHDSGTGFHFHLQTPSEL